MNWEVEEYYSDKDCTKSFGKDDDNKPIKPSWLPRLEGVSSSDGYVGGDGSVANYTIAAQSYTKSGKHDEILANNTINSIPSDGWPTINLSTTTTNNTATGKTETANCYIVNHQGTFEFPLVYGNKSDDGNEPEGFVDHKGSRITKRLIKDQIESKNPADGEYEIIVTGSKRKRTSYTWRTISDERNTLRAVLVWQDVNGLISSVNATTNSIYFTVNKSTPGNAVIALEGRTETVYEVYEKLDDGGSKWEVDTSQGVEGYDHGDWETFWTWHIWMTDEVYPNYSSVSSTNVNTQYLNNNPNNGKEGYMGDHIVTIQDKGGDTHTILPVNLGWVPDKMAFGYYSKRECWVKLQQTKSKEDDVPASTVVHIVQHARQPLVTGTSTVYQWGRPTALPMVKHVDDTPNTIYANTDVFGSFSYKKITDYWDFLANPLNILKNKDNSESWLKDSKDLWKTGEKTVYDPCPPGFQLPDGAIFTGMSLTGNYASSGTDLNMWEDAGEAGKGGYFYTTKHTAPIPADDANRYGSLFYMPATGRWSGDQDEGVAVFKYDDKRAGVYWLGSHKDKDTGYSLWGVPDKTYTTDGDKKAISFKSELNNINYALPIRPTGDLPAAE